MISLIQRYSHWLHTKWHAGLVEKLPETGEGGTTALPGVRIVGYRYRKEWKFSETQSTWRGIG